MPAGRPPKPRADGTFLPKRHRKVKPPMHNRQGPVTQNEKDLVAAYVMDQPSAVTPDQENALAVALKRTPLVVKRLIQDARQNFAAKAGRYVEVHMEATEKALQAGTVTGLDVALRGSQWAIERIAEDGARVVDKATEQNAGTKIVLGIQMGGIAPTVIEAK